MVGFGLDPSTGARLGWQRLGYFLFARRFFLCNQEICQEGKMGGGQKKSLVKSVYPVMLYLLGKFLFRSCIWFCSRGRKKNYVEAWLSFSWLVRDSVFFLLQSLFDSV